MLSGYKLFRVRRDGSLGSLFIDKKKVLPVGQWLNALEVPTKGFAFRPGFHACSEPVAPHLSKEGRVWARVSLIGVTKHRRPETQGGLWYTAKRMRIDDVQTAN
jgi:hypothetical protein